MTDSEIKTATSTEDFAGERAEFLGFRWPRRRRPEAQILASELDLLAAEQLFPTDPIIKQIKSRFRDHQPSEQIAAAVELRKRMLILGSASDVRLKRLILHLRERYATALGPVAALKYANTQIDLDAEETTSADLHAEADSLLEQLKLIYTLSSERDALLARMRRWALFLLVGLFLALLFASLGDDVAAQQVQASLSGQKDQAVVDAAKGVLFSRNDGLNMAIIAVIGAAGAMVSLLRRTENVTMATAADVDPVRQVSALQQGVTAVFISAFVGAAVALVLLALFATSKIQPFVPSALHALLPQIIECPLSQQKGCMSLVDYRIRMGGFSDMGKMLIWAFIGGFAEQLVPDILDRITNAAKASQKTDAPASNTPASGR